MEYQYLFYQQINRRLFSEEKRNEKNDYYCGCEYSSSRHYLG